MRILVTGGAGFIGSHLIDRLMKQDHEVICLDNFFTGHKQNLLPWLNHPAFELIRHDITEPIRLEVDQINHLARPASPVHYQHNPVKTIKTNVMGTLNMLGLAQRVKEISRKEFPTCRVSYSPTGMAPLKRSVMHRSPVFWFLEISQGPLPTGFNLRSLWRSGSPSAARRISRQSQPDRHSERLRRREASRRNLSV